MDSAQFVNAGIRAPRVWLGVAFLGVWLYLISQLLQVYPAWVIDSIGLTKTESLQVLALTSNFGQILFLSGVVAALWRANLAAGLSPSGIRGLVLGSAGVGVLVFFEIARLLDWFRITFGPVGAVLEARTVGDIFGIALGFAGIASLGVGLTQAAGLFERRAEELPPATASGTEKPT